MFLRSTALHLVCAMVGKEHLVQGGYTLVELMVVMSIAASLLGFGIINLFELSRPAQGATGQLAGFFKAARAKAISTTSSYTVRPLNPSEIIVETSRNCSTGTPLVDPELKLELPAHVLLSNTSWSVCFDSRGFADSNMVATIEDNYGEAYSVEVYLGGATRIL